jgi:HAD superfamily hydrolase (TIGR01509 family)
VRPVLLFDVMDTLVVEPFHRVMPGFFGLTSEELIAAKHPTAWVEFEAGEIGEEEFLARFFRDGRAFDHAAFRRTVRDSYGWLPGMEGLLAELKGRGYPIHALSNYPPWFRMIEERLALSRYLEWSFVSCLTGVRKPDPRAFTGAVAALGVAAEECLFVDDRERNCGAARALGLQAVRFTSAGELRGELVRRGLLGGRMEP